MLFGEQKQIERRRRGECISESDPSVTSRRRRRRRRRKRSENGKEQARFFFPHQMFRSRCRGAENLFLETVFPPLCLCSSAPLDWILSTGQSASFQLFLNNQPTCLSPSYFPTLKRQEHETPEKPPEQIPPSSPTTPKYPDPEPALTPHYFPLTLALRGR